MDEELLSDIRKSIAEISSRGSREDVIEMSEKEADAVADSVARTYVEQPNSLWWWSHLRAKSWIDDYSEAEVPERLQEIIGNRRVRLVVTDDEPRPWPVFEGEATHILGIIFEQRFFEYFLVPASTGVPDWIIFDNHENQLVVVGLPARTA